MSLYRPRPSLKFFKSHICGLCLLVFSLSFPTFVALLDFCTAVSSSAKISSTKFSSSVRSGGAMPELLSSALNFFLIWLIKIPTWSLTDLYPQQRQVWDRYSIPNFASLRQTFSCFLRIPGNNLSAWWDIALACPVHHINAFSFFSIKKINVKSKLTLIL